MNENVLENLNKEFENLKNKQIELTGQLEQARQDNEQEKTKSGQALIQNKSMTEASAGLIKSQDKIVILENALQQIAANIKKCEADIKAEKLKIDTLAINELGKKAKSEADQIAGEMTKIINSLLKLQGLYEKVLLLSSGHWPNITRPGSLQLQPGNLIPFMLNLLAQVGHATDNEKCRINLKEIEEKTGYVRA